MKITAPAEGMDLVMINLPKRVLCQWSVMAFK